MGMGLGVADLWAQDDGTLCGWSCRCPNLTGRTSPRCSDSRLDRSLEWPTDTDPATPLVARVVNTPGTFAYVFTVTDNFGCTYDTTVTVTVPDVSLQGIDGPSGVTGDRPGAVHGPRGRRDVTAFNWTPPWLDLGRRSGHLRRDRRTPPPGNSALSCSAFPRWVQAASATRSACRVR